VSIEVISIIGIGILVVILFFLVFLRDSEVSKKLGIYERVIEDLNRENHNLSRSIEKLASKDKLEIKIFKDEIQKEIKFQVQTSLLPMVDSIREIEAVMLNFQDQQIARIDSLENRTKEINYIPPNVTESNERQIISQYKNGKSEAKIAKDLRIGIGEVDLILKLANLK